MSAMLVITVKRGGECPYLAEGVWKEDKSAIVFV